MTTKENIIINSFSNGDVIGLVEKGDKPKIIQTQISRIFLFKDKAYKFYRHDNNDFNRLYFDLSNEISRKNFYIDDFYTNHYFSPSVYLKLIGINIDNLGSVSLVENTEKCFDLVIEMKRVDTKNNLTSRLREHNLGKDDAKYLGFEMTKAIDLFPHRPKTVKNYYEIMVNFLDDLYAFLRLADPNITKQEADSIRSYLSNIIESKKGQYKVMSGHDFVNSIDNHSDNIFYDNKTITLLDSYLPVMNWRITEPLYCIYRPATDLAVWMGDDFKNSMLSGYIDYYKEGEIDLDSDRMYLVYFAAIRSAYFYLLFKESHLEDHRVMGDTYKKFILSRLGNV